ncbi:SDR family NAD(P)-dependent oxidoreductase [Leptospira brenneri]|uniref:SDR family NAD(P)-dependent oxidoreductase n=1 Tax=Leptospira brenneri TaxID=2023182 RepID=UPI000C29A796|nr:SDR family NAD(P)-dependent oxidoreductase [Leptospira brenneri]PJZ44933.1 short-chain dehydrogenase/reductase [Leptospira brenneri]
MKQTILVTGASSGIGRLVASQLHKEGHSVIGTSRYPEKYRSELPYPLLELDLSSDSSIGSFGKRLFQQIGHLDVLINNAGFLVKGLAEETSVTLGKEQFETNFWGTVKVTNEILPYLRAKRKGKIITIGSFLGRISLPSVAYYSASKHSLEGYFKSLRFELNEFNIHVSMVEPMSFKTNIGESSISSEGNIPDYDSVRKKVAGFSKAEFANSPSPEPVIQTVLKLVNKKNPGFHYPVGKGARLILFLQHFAYRLFETSILKKMNQKN